MSNRIRIYMTGVGGQGTLTATTLLARVAVAQGVEVVAGEIHGMAQRGGVVESTILLGGWKSPKLGFGEADIVLGFEPLETLRGLCYLKQGGEFKLAASAEFIERPDALPAFEKAYGFNLNQNQLLSLAGGDTAVTIKAAAQQTSGVNSAMAYGTDGPVAALGLQTLSDPQGVQPIYAPTPVVREAVLKAYPQIADWLQPVFASLDEKTLQQLNARIAVEGQDAKRVAADYLQQKGLLK